MLPVCISGALTSSGRLHPLHIHARLLIIHGSWDALFLLNFLLLSSWNSLTMLKTVWGTSGLQVSQGTEFKPLSQDSSWWVQTHLTNFKPAPKFMHPTWDCSVFVESPLYCPLCLCVLAFAISSPSLKIQVQRHLLSGTFFNVST